jgi:hypothetical protein
VGDWRRLHSEKLHNLYASSDIIRRITPSRMKTVGHVARMGTILNAYKFLVGNPEGRDH